MKLLDIYTGFRHCCGIDCNNNLYAWGYFFGNKPQFIDYKVKLINCGNDVIVYLKDENIKNINLYNNKNKKIVSININIFIKEIFCGNENYCFKNNYG